MYLIKEWHLNIKTVSEANCSQHWTKVAARRKLQRHTISLAWLKETPNIGLPCTVRLIRIGSKRLDVGDNLPMAFKAIRDAIAERIIPDRPPGFADASPLIIWEYDQIKGAPSGIMVQFWADDPEMSRAAQNFLAAKGMVV